MSTDKNLDPRAELTERAQLAAHYYQELRKGDLPGELAEQLLLDWHGRRPFAPQIRLIVREEVAAMLEDGSIPNSVNTWNRKYPGYK